MEVNGSLDKKRTLSASLSDKRTINASLQRPSGGGKITVDPALSDTSTNPVQNKVVTAAINAKANSSDVHNVPSGGSAGQALFKSSATDFDATWDDIPLQVCVGTTEPTDPDVDVWIDPSGSADYNAPLPASTAPAMDGTASRGSSTQYARADHVHPSDTSKITAPSAPADGAFLVYNGSAWVAQTLAAWQGGNY
jgi:hypothetical protein